MLKITKTSEILQALKPIRQNLQIALVATMGNLHRGHLTLIEYAKAHADYVVVTIFVNPTQFNSDQDFSSYPRTIENDLLLLEQMQVDLVFMPETTELYADQPNTKITVEHLDNIHCGLYRPGHFQGVAIVVLKLFNLIQADIAIFGMKDYQQLLIIQTIAKDLAIQTKIIGLPIVREDDGLAQSSRNQHLSKTERETAPNLYKTLAHIAEQIKQGKQRYTELEQQAQNTLKTYGFEPEYITICDAQSLGAPIRSQQGIILGAAWLGSVRLIDNILLPSL